MIGWSADSPAGTGEQGFALVRFDDLFGDGPNQIPPGAAITSATLTYWLEEGESLGEIREIAVDWDETATGATFGPAPGVQLSDFSSRRFGAARGAGEIRSINVWESLAKWSDAPSLNRGWIFRPANTVTYAQFGSSEHADVDRRIRLEVVVNDTGAPMLVRHPYVQSVGQSTFTLKWRTDMKTDSLVRFGPAPEALNQLVYVDGATRDHEVTIANLAPGVTYYYSVGTSNHTLAGGDEAHRVRTAPPNSFSGLRHIWAMGDSGTPSVVQAATRDAMLAHIGDAPDAILHAGDLAYFFGADGEYTDGLFTPFRNVLRTTPLWPTLGTHDELNANSSTGVGVYYECFALPTAGEAGGTPSTTEAYYSFDIGDAHFVSVNTKGVSSAPESPMRQWLEDDLAELGARWLIALVYSAPYSNGAHNADTDGGQIAARENIVPLLEAAGVDLVISGYSHGYERTYLIDGAYDTPVVADGHILNAGDGDPAGDGAYTKPSSLTPRAGAVYVVAGHSQSSHRVKPHPIMAAGENHTGSLLIMLEGDTMMVENVRSSGVVADRFAIVKMQPPTADFNGDGVVNGADLAVLLALWGPCDGCAADLDGNGAVNGADLATLLSQWS